MLRKYLCLLLALLLCGCSAAQPVVTTLPTLTETTVSTEPDTEPTTSMSTTCQTEPAFDPYTIIETMSTQELVGQLFLARYPGYERAAADIENFHIGNYILFGKDFESETPASITSILSNHQTSSKLPMLFAVDEEGGDVTRISCYPQYGSARFSALRVLFEQGGIDLMLEAEEEKCNLLVSLGINVNMAPVCDITTDPGAFMYRRSLGQDPETTGTCISQIAALMQEHGIGSVLKHFPGYGNNADTHTGIAFDSRSLDTLKSADLIPFQTCIDSGCDAILISHTIVECLDPDMPASLSPSVITYLRKTMGFDGVIVTDDLSMQAISDIYGEEESAVLAVLAGCDLLCSSEYEVQYDAIITAVGNGRISLDRLKASVARILQWKYDLGLLSVQ